MMCLQSLRIVVDLGRQLIKSVWAYALLEGTRAIGALQAGATGDQSVTCT
jgi:hypothetical protein